MAFFFFCYSTATTKSSQAPLYLCSQKECGLCLCMRTRRVGRICQSVCRKSHRSTTFAFLLLRRKKFVFLSVLVWSSPIYRHRRHRGQMPSSDALHFLLSLPIDSAFRSSFSFYFGDFQPSCLMFHCILLHEFLCCYCTHYVRPPDGFSYLLEVLLLECALGLIA